VGALAPALLGVGDELGRILGEDGSRKKQDDERAAHPEIILAAFSRAGLAREGMP